MTGMVVFYLLVLVRVLAFFSVVPLFSQKKIPALWKVGTGVVVTLLILPLLSPRPLPANPGWLCLAILWESAVGMSFAMIMTCSLGAVLSAGSLIDTQMGFANSGVLNPAGEAPEPITAAFYQTIFLLLCLKASYHLYLLRIFLESFHWMSVGMILDKFEKLSQMGLLLFGQFFVSVAWLVLPVSLALLASEVCLAFLSRLIPQMNMLIAAAPIRVLAGLFLVSLSMPVTLNAMSGVVESCLRTVEVFGV